MSSSLNSKWFAFSLCLIFQITSNPSFSRAESFTPHSDETLPLSSLSVPEEIGKVQERFTGSNTRTILQIQDIHAHAAAQQNIASILERLRTVFNIKTVALEGAWSATSLPKSHAIPTSREKQLLSKTLLEDDLISGPAYAAIMSPAPITLVGVEEEDLYEKNRSLFLTHLTQTPEITSKLQAYGASLQTIQKATWSPDLLTFGNAFASFQENPDLGKFLPLLLKTADTQSLSPADLPQVVLLQDILALEKSFSKERLNQEVKQLIKKYKNTSWTLEELIRGGKIPAQEIGLYPEIKKLTRLYKLRDDISLKELTDEIETLTGRVLEKLIVSPEEKALWDKTGRFFLAKKLLLLEATPADLRAYEREKASLQPELSSTDLSAALTLSLDFYDTVRKRDQVFFDKIMSTPSLSGDIAIVTGGFHTDGLSEKFREAGISYITIAPDLGGEKRNEKLYNERMEETRGTGDAKRETQSLNVPRSPFPASASADDQTLSELRNAIAWTDTRYPESYEVLVQVHDVRKAKAVFLGAPAAVPGADRITHLSRTKKIIPRPSTGTTYEVSNLRMDEFLKKPRTEQIQNIRGWLDQGLQQREKAMLVSSVSVLIKMMAEDPRVQTILERAIAERDIIVLAQDIPSEETPLSLRGIERFEAEDIEGMMAKTPRFQRLAKAHPFAVMKEGYRDEALVILPEKAVSLVLYRIITLNPNLYQAAKDPAFLALLEGLVSEILSQDLSGKAA